MVSLSADHPAESPRPDGHALISVMGDHTHHAGEVMLSYRFMRMQMDGIRSGTDGLSTARTFDRDYAVVPEDMLMEMHMFGVMYAPLERLTLMAMANYVSTEMDHAINPATAATPFAGGGAPGFTAETEGFGDTSVTALYRFLETEHQQLHAGLGLSLPTGSIDERDETPGVGGFSETVLPASMQLGSGTFDLLPSVTYLYQQPNYTLGAQARGVIRLEDENDEGYRRGHVAQVQGWGLWKLSRWLAPGLRLGLRHEGELEGEQASVSRTPLPPVQAQGISQTVTTAYSENYGGTVADLGLGVNFIVADGPLTGNRLAVELALPIWRDLNGEQLETDYTVTVGWQFSW